jgi:uncharacterized protein (TIGR02284 family)
MNWPGTTKTARERFRAGAEDAMAERTARMVVNDLIENCRDAARGFRDAAGLLKDASLQGMLLDLADERQAFAAELELHAQRLGGDAAGAGTAAATVHRRWMEVKSTLTSHDEHAIMIEVRRGDAVTLRVFGEALTAMLPVSIRDIVERQETRIRDGHARIERAITGRRLQTLL